jgi:putative membrane protein
MKIYFQEGEKILYKSFPKNAILFLWFFRACLYAAIITFFLRVIYSVSYMISNMEKYEEDYFLLLIIFIIFLGIAFAYEIALLRTYAFIITNERIIIAGGILLRKMKSVPYHKITDISITQNLIERLLGISSLNVHTAGTGTNRPEIRFFSLHNPERPQSILVKELRIFKTGSGHSVAVHD